MSKDEYLQNKYEFEMNEVWPLVNDMEKRGMACDPDLIKQEADICRKAVDLHYKEMVRIIHEQNLLPHPQEKTEPKILKSGKVSPAWKPPVFNPASPPQLTRLLYLPTSQGGLGIEPHYSRKKPDSLTTDKDALRELMYVPFVRELSAWRSASQALSLFFDKFEELVCEDPLVSGGWMIHPGMNQCGTKTGRFSASNPNLQQLSDPNKSLSANYNARKPFGPRPGYCWLSLDYSQQEVRIFAYLAQVPAMLEAMSSGRDVFEAMANQVWGGKDNPKAYGAAVQALDLFREPANDLVKAQWQRYNWTSKEATEASARLVADVWLSEFNHNIVEAEASVGKKSSRQRCKHIVYAKIFGGGPGSYTHLLYCTLEEAKEFDKDFNERSPEMKRYMNGLQKQARNEGFVVNLYNRKLRVDYDFPYRAVSYIVQGSAADMMKTALVKIHKFLKTVRIDAHLILTIHDEAKLEVKESQINRAFISKVKEIMEDTSKHVGIPMPTEATLIKSGGKWGIESDEEKVKLYETAV